MKFSGSHDAPKTLEILNRYYVIDKEQVYYRGKVVEGADAGIFKPIPTTMGRTSGGGSNRACARRILPWTDRKNNDERSLELRLRYMYSYCFITFRETD
jgi:hypothetical protein